MVFSVLFALAETAYFGWNWSAASDAERTADAVAGLIFIVSSAGYALAFAAKH
jgi:hypothetical protein